MRDMRRDITLHELHILRRDVYPPRPDGPLQFHIIHVISSLPDVLVPEVLRVLSSPDLHVTVRHLVDLMRVLRQSVNQNAYPDGNEQEDSHTSGDDTEHLQVSDHPGEDQAYDQYQSSDDTAGSHRDLIDPLLIRFIDPAVPTIEAVLLYLNPVGI